LTEQNKGDVRLGRFISLVLRHDPSAAGITLDKHGWAETDKLLSGMRKQGYEIDRDILERIVRENNKNRYSFNEDHSKIRANQGHSVDVDVEMKACVPPDVLYHGTAGRFIGSIRKNGITRQFRQHVHLSADMETAAAVGRRHGKPAVLQINAAKMAADGYIFWLSENGVWLCEQVPVEYIMGSGD